MNNCVMKFASKALWAWLEIAARECDAVKLPPGLSEETLRCTTLGKCEFLVYAYLLCSTLGLMRLVASDFGTPR